MRAAVTILRSRPGLMPGEGSPAPGPGSTAAGPFGSGRCGCPQAALAAGVDGSLTPPLDLAELLEGVERLAGRPMIVPRKPSGGA